MMIVKRLTSYSKQYFQVSNHDEQYFSMKENNLVYIHKTKTHWNESLYLFFLYFYDSLCWEVYEYINFNFCLFLYLEQECFIVLALENSVKYATEIMSVACVYTGIKKSFICSRFSAFLLYNVFFQLYIVNKTTC